jgi:uncharacterized protein YebE (UPF0316 family)
MNLILLFIILTTCNVVLGTVKSLLTINGTKFWAALINAVSYAVNAAAVIYMTDDQLNFWLKLIIVAAINYIGVYIVKYIEEKNIKEKLWKIECITLSEYAEAIHAELDNLNIYNRYIEGVGKYVIVNIYAETKEQSKLVKTLLKNYNVRYFVVESQIL